MMDTLRNILVGILQGFFDSIKGLVIVFYLDREINERTRKKFDIQFIERDEDRRVTGSGSISSKETAKKLDESNVMKRVFQCCALNGGVFWLSIVIFEYGLLPAIKCFLTVIFGETSVLASHIWNWMKPSLSIVFSMIWILPLFVLSRIVNSLWFQDIADSAFKFRKGRPQLIPSISKLIADTLFSLLVQSLFLVQSMLVNLLPVPYVGGILCFIHICLLYSLYSFEYKWFNMGWELHKRLSYIERNWPYFLGFGMPLAILTQLPDSIIVSGCVFSIAFPIFILSGNEATPVFGKCVLPLKLFSPVIALSNSFFSRSLRSAGSPSLAARTTSYQTKETSSSSSAYKVNTPSSRSTPLTKASSIASTRN